MSAAPTPIIRKFWAHKRYIIPRTVHTMCLDVINIDDEALDTDNQLK